MDRYINLTPEIEKTIWEKGIFIFDTSSICEMYKLNQAARESVSHIITYLKNRIWIPGHVQYEYSKNRIEVINETIKKSLSEFNTDTKFTQAYTLLDNFIGKVNKGDFLPYFREEIFGKIKESIQKSKEEYKSAYKLIKDELKARTEELKAIKDNDCILNAFSNVEHGQEFSYHTILEIVKEGAFRYSHKIPPGYMDEEDKIGTQRYGDLIIWKEIIAYSRSKSLPIIYICNDLKEDYYDPENKTIDIPRHELIKEFIDETGQLFWMYTLSSFLEKLNEHYKDDADALPLFDGLEAVVEVLKRKERLAYLRSRRRSGIVLKCDTCDYEFDVYADELTFEWEEEGESERGMGTEKEYVSYEFCRCPHCDSQINLYLSVWEYPVGAFNYQTIEADGAEVIKGINLEDKINFYIEDTECVRCGENAPIDELGLCSDCRYTYDKMMKED